MSNLPNSEELSNSAKDFINELTIKSEFKPFAYYDKHLDCIRVQTLDCSFKEDRKNKFVTVLSANHKEQNTFVGFNIKGVKYLFKKIGLPTSGVHKLTDLVDKLVKTFPDAGTVQVQKLFRPILIDQDLSVEFN